MIGSLSLSPTSQRPELGSLARSNSTRSPSKSPIFFTASPSTTSRSVLIGEGISPRLRSMLSSTQSLAGLGNLLWPTPRRPTLKASANQPVQYSAKQLGGPSDSRMVVGCWSISCSLLAAATLGADGSPGLAVGSPTAGTNLAGIQSTRIEINGGPLLFLDSTRAPRG